MILVDVFVPNVDMTYDFQLNESIAVDTLIEEISEMISQKEKSDISGNIKDLILCDYFGNRILNKNESLKDQGIVTGHKLILV